MNPFPKLNGKTLDAVTAWINFVCTIRTSDASDRNNFPNIFLTGRRVVKIPTSSSDITGSAAGDFNVTSTYAYYCINNAGTIEWVRTAVGTF